MLAYKIETVIQRDGYLALDTLPLRKGERVEVVILNLSSSASPTRRCFSPFKPIKLHGGGLSASEMLIQDRN
jgi:hypothetical protein